MTLFSRLPLTLATAALLLCAAAPHALAAGQVHVSNNWSGYEAVDGTYTGVSGAWTVPEADTSDRKGLSAHAVWVGIGGAGTPDLIQAGTQAVVVNGKTVYSAWYETLPDPERELPLDVSPGDQVSVSLEEVALNVWQLTFLNATTGTSYIAYIPYHSSRLSAEWVVERPSSVTKRGKQEYLDLNDFGTVRFSSAEAVRDGERVGLSDAEAEKVIMNRGTNVYASAVPSEIEDDAFSVAHYSKSKGRAYMREFRRTYKLVRDRAQEKTAPSAVIVPVDGTTVIHISL
jgi:hypothetical protein